MSMAPRDFPDDDDDGDHSQPDAHDDADLGFDAGPPAGALDPLAAFLKELEDLDSMSGPDIMAAIADLPVPQEGFVDGMAFQDAVEVLVGKTHVMKSYMISYMISLQAKLLPAHNMENSRAFTRSERILLDHQNLKRMNAVDLRDLIRDVLHNPEFNASEVDHDMHERLMHAVEEGEMEIIDMWQDGDLVTDQMLRAVWARLRDRLCSLDSPSSMVEVTTAYATHFTDMYVDKHTGKHMTGDRVRILLLTLPFLLRDLIAPEVWP